MAVGKGSIKRASDAAKVKAEAKIAGGEAVSVEEKKDEEIVDTKKQGEKENKLEEKPEAKAKKTATKKAAAKKSETAKKAETAKKSAEAAKKADTNKKTAKDSTNERKTYEIVEGISCSMPTYLL